MDPCSGALHRFGDLLDEHVDGFHRFRQVPLYLQSQGAESVHGDVGKVGSAQEARGMLRRFLAHGRESLMALVFRVEAWEGHLQDFLVNVPGAEQSSGLKIFDDEMGTPEFRKPDKK